ncbi:hypothetical protein RXV86_06515 [Alisedimentitalea sp. MJ-SS2]|uniref:hypothetical protein n=1 Tax=Aliisedimentitalea sp. MJ-SS2 TaxID=3049795 RepID=UPI002911D50A|nr:hypothetical protein [Alisedimentitalea sp. MJ-SS2]MDU8927030.1 hypothetical protein [Alisedimentitalea sp. MJ-SS2]
MKKILLAAAVTGSLVAMPAIADTKADPFVSTQGALSPLAVAGIAGGIIIIGIAASDGS